MAFAKKGKKSKGKTVPLVDFLQETPGPVVSMPIRKSTLNWADDVEDNHDVYDSRSSKANVVLPTAPKASRDFDDISDKVPQDGPYIAYLSNLPYDVDENEISAFFKNMKIANMRIPKDDRSGEVPKLKGFGYVEFEDRDSLLNALVIPDTTIKNRRIRIEVASDFDNDKRRSGRMDMNRDRGNRGGEVPSGDWRSGPRTESSDGGERRGDRGGFNRDRDNNRDRDDSSAGAWRDGGGRNRDTSDRGFSRQSDRFSRDDQDGGYRSNRDNDNKGGGFMSRSSRNGGFTRSSAAAPRDDSESARTEPRQRPKLVLAPRTKPVEQVEAEKPKVSASAAIFGNAKPVDTSARERQIEERLAKDHSSDGGPVRREVSKERKSEEVLSHKEKKEKLPENEKKTVERTASSNSQKSDANGIIEKSHPKRTNDYEKKDLVKSEAGVDKQYKADNKKREEKREKVEKEMPKLKKAEPPNFIANNKFAFLETEDNSD